MRESEEFVLIQFASDLYFVFLDSNFTTWTTQEVVFLTDPVAPAPSNSHPCRSLLLASWGWRGAPAIDGVLDEMYGGGGGGGDSDGEDEGEEEEDSDAEEDAEMMDELMQEEAESGDEQVGGGIKHGDFFDDDDDEG